MQVGRQQQIKHIKAKKQQMYLDEAGRNDLVDRSLQNVGTGNQVPRHVMLKRDLSDIF
jgi:hypothetical protein